MPKQIDWMRYKLRTCYTMHDCALCAQTIRLGQVYYDGGYGRRAHFDCVPLEKGDGKSN